MLMQDADSEFVVLTAEIFNLAVSSNGGFSRAQLALLGITFPPPKGWKQQVVGTRAPRKVIEEFVSLKDKHLQKRHKNDGDVGSRKIQQRINPANFIERNPSEGLCCMKRGCGG